MDIRDTKVALTDLSHDISWQRFSVPYQYPVAFVRGVFDPANPLFAQIVSGTEPAKRHSCFFIKEEDWLNPAPIDQRTLFEGNSILRGGREPRIEAPGERRAGQMLIE